MKDTKKVAVCSRSFSRHPVLRAELLALYPQAIFNDAGKEFSPDELVEFLQDSEMAIVGLEKITYEILEKLPGLKVISKYGVGLDALDLEAFKKLNIRLGWTSGVNKRSVAELAIGLMLACLRNLFELNQLVKTGGWHNKTGLQLSGKCVGLVGLGHVGQDLTHLLKAFGCKIIASDILDKSEFANANGVSLVSKEELFKNADIVSLHLPLTPENRHFISAELLSLMKSGAILINTARGGLVKEKDLLQVLSSKKIAAAAFDVLETEPPKENALLTLDNFFMSPHIGGSTAESILAMGRSAILGLQEAKSL